MQIFQGNTNTHISEMREVDPPLIARRIRFAPYSSHSKIVCLRVELYGCVWTGKFAGRSVGYRLAVRPVALFTQRRRRETCPACRYECHLSGGAGGGGGGVTRILIEPSREWRFHLNQWKLLYVEPG